VSPHALAGILLACVAADLNLWKNEPLAAHAVPSAQRARGAEPVRRWFGSPLYLPTSPSNSTTIYSWIALDLSVSRMTL
jgi:hypothetical protein